MILLVILSVVVFPTFVTMNYSYFPIQVHTCDPTKKSIFVKANQVVPTGDDVSPCEMRETELEVRVGFQIYALSLMVVLGWFLLVVFLPTGMQGIPFDYGA